MPNLRDLISTINLSNIKPDAQWPDITLYTGSGTHWRVVFVHHLTGAENGGRHHIYVDLVDEQLKLLDPAAYNAKIGYTWENQQPEEQKPPAPMDKQAPEPAGNVVMYGGQVTTVYIDSGYPSDWVGNLRTSGLGELDSDPASGNFQGHHSYYVVFMLYKSEIVQPPVIPTPGELINFQPIIDGFLAVSLTVNKLVDDLRAAIDKLGEKP